MAPGQLSRAAMVAITLLRVAIGWHFLYEGVAKLTSMSWSSAGYLKQSRGPLAGFFKWIASDANVLANVDLVTIWGLTIVGGLLMLGLFTRLATLGAIGFLAMFYAASPPLVGSFNSFPTEGTYLIVNKNLVELFALFVILLTRSGRFAGLDRLVYGVLARRPWLATALT
jgi:thiosulfate dehydrogenase [quinone] large subunit